MSSEVSSLFAKKKGKKGKKKSTTLNLDPTAPKTDLEKEQADARQGRPNLSRETVSGANGDREKLIFPAQLTTSRVGNHTGFCPICHIEKPKIAQLQEILGGPNPSEDDGWAEVVEKKSVVATGGKQVSDLIDMTSLMEDDETTASKLEKQDIKQAFHHARTMKEAKKKENAPDAPKKEDAEKVSEAAVAKPKGLSGNIFGGGGAAGRGGPGAGWQTRMAERELRQREQQLSVDNTSAFPTLADAMSGPPKPKQGGAAPELNPWVRRGGGSAAAAAIKAALGRGGDEESKTGGTVGSVSAASAAEPVVEATPPAPKPQPAAPMWVPPQRRAKTGADEASNASAVVGDGDAATSAADDSATKGHEDASESSSAPAPVAEPVIDITEPAPSQEAQTQTKAGDENIAKEGEQSTGDSKVDTATAPPLEAASDPSAPPAADKEALVQQFGKKKKKKKKPVDGDT